MYILGSSRTNDNPLGTRHIRHEANLRPSVRNILASSALLFTGLTLSARAGAQATASLQIDGTVLPRHRLGVRLLTGFARFDELMGNGGTRNIAASFNADSLTGAQIPGLGSTETAVRALSGVGGFAVNAGRIVATANSRVVTAPLILEYGVTSRLTVGVVVPLVETRSTVFAQLNPQPGTANVGLNPGAPGWTTNASLVTSLRTAATNLQKALTDCQATPSGPGCSTLLAQQAQAQALIASTTPLANGLEALYGTSATTPGLSFVPLASSAAQSAINARIAGVRSSYQSFGRTVVDATPTGANVAARADLQAILAGSGYDSLQSTDRSSIGDVTIGATYQLANTYGDSARLHGGGLLYRLAVNGGFRLGTGEPANRNTLFDNSTGYGQPGAIVGAAADLRFTQRFFMTGVGSYTKQIGTVAVERVANAQNAALPLTVNVPANYSAGDELSLTLIPRYRVAGLFTIDGVYGLRHVAADSYESALAGLPIAKTADAIDPVAPYGIASATAQQLGIGVTYSSSFSDRNPGRLPYEASFRHTETINATGGPVAKTFVDQIQLRVFFR